MQLITTPDEGRATRYDAFRVESFLTSADIHLDGMASNCVRGSHD